MKVNKRNLLDCNIYWTEQEWSLLLLFNRYVGIIGYGLDIFVPCYGHGFSGWNVCISKFLDQEFANWVVRYSLVLGKAVLPGRKGADLKKNQMDAYSSTACKLTRDFLVQKCRTSWETLFLCQRCSLLCAFSFAARSTRDTRHHSSLHGGGRLPT